jgi:TPR repeat protein
MKHALAAIILALSLTAPVAAGPFEDATAAYDKGDYAAALRLLGPLANQGDAIAQSNLGFMYFRGQGVLQNHDEAAATLAIACKYRDLSHFGGGACDAPSLRRMLHMNASHHATRLYATGDEGSLPPELSHSTANKDTSHHLGLVSPRWAY